MMAACRRTPRQPVALLAFQIELHTKQAERGAQALTHLFIQGLALFVLLMCVFGYRFVRVCVCLCACLLLILCLSNMKTNYVPLGVSGRVCERV